MNQNLAWEEAPSSLTHQSGRVSVGSERDDVRVGVDVRSRRLAAEKRWVRFRPNPAFGAVGADVAPRHSRTLGDVCSSAGHELQSGRARPERRVYEDAELLARTTAVFFPLLTSEPTHVIDCAPDDLEICILIADRALRIGVIKSSHDGL